MSDRPSWRELLVEATERLGDRTDARRIVERASGHDGAQLTLALNEQPTVLGLKHFDTMLERRAAGEPLQYVLGRWGFRHLDVLVDRRVLIPRPETEVVVDHALALVDELHARVAVDLGTGSGVIALSLAFERPSLAVWATDRSADALHVAGANLAGIGRAAARVQLALGDWYAALPPELEGTIDVVVSNPPYVAAGDPLPAEVRDWEPAGALVAGPTGLEAVESILGAAPAWLAPRGGVVLEIGETQGDAVTAIARAAGFRRVGIRDDLTGRPRVLVAVRTE